jgi:MYXO-CTERM domain-containing protein
VDQRHPHLATANLAKIPGFARRARAAGQAALDRRTVRSWIAVAGLSVFVALLAACSGTEDSTASGESALGAKGRWAPPSDVLAAGAKVRIDYEDAPKWTGTAACGGQLKAGGHKLGEYLLDHFSDVSSVGGYACRRNTADSSRMSVHGTGRALDVFIPTSNGAADNGKGDRVANWLVLHAARIGVQLVIWDRSVWRANGTNDAAYGGPVPHIDHIHVELTNAASALATPWFSDMSDAPDSGADDDASTADGGGGGGGSTDGATSAADAGTTGSTGTTGTDAGAKKDAAPVDPANDDSAQDAPDSSTATGSGSVAPSGTGDPSDGLTSAADDPGETDSLPDVPASKHRTSSGSATDANGDPVPNAGCSAAPQGGRAPVPGTLWTLALALGLAAWLRRKR